jgi:hypothetical protein
LKYATRHKSLKSRYVTVPESTDHQHFSKHGSRNQNEKTARTFRHQLPLKLRSVSPTQQFTATTVAQPAPNIAVTAGERLQTRFVENK